MPNSFFQFKQFKIDQELSGMKVTTDACLFGGLVAKKVQALQPTRILDIGTGTGLLALMLAQQTECPVDAIEVDRAAFNQARQNFETSPWTSRLQAYHMPVQDFETEWKYDLIICNPPFFSNHQQGIDAGKNKALHTDQLSFEDLTTVITQHLSEKGKAYVLLPEYEMSLFSALMSEKGLSCFEQTRVLNNPGKAVFRCINGFSAEETAPVSEAELVIRADQNEYSDQFTALLKDYYLHL